ncbi:MAG: hypothetical protein FIB08_03665 [Candidatus Methanoperedens sp.]|nr:hypothetical protein [Candidatus Methanoperedens sp.]
MAEEITGLKVTISADVKAAIVNVYKFQTYFTNLGTTVKKQSVNIVDFLKKMKMGWIALGVGAIATMTSLANQSSYMSMWFTEAMGAVGYFMDTALEPLSPIIETVLNGLYLFGDWFSTFPDVVKGAVGALILAINTLGIGSLIDKIFGTTFAADVVAFIKGVFTTAGGSILGAIAAGIGLGMTAVWILDKLGVWNALEQAGKDLETKIPQVFDLLRILTAPLLALGSTVLNIVRGEWDRIIPDLKIRLWDDSFKKVWDYVDTQVIAKISEMLHGWSETLKNWAKGIIGFSPTLKQIGAEIPDTIIGGAAMNPVNVGSIVSTTGTATGTTAGTTVINFSPTINVNNATLRSDMDIRTLANQLSNFWRDDLTRYARGVI